MIVFVFLSIVIFLITFLSTLSLKTTLSPSSLRVVITSANK